MKPIWAPWRIEYILSKKPPGCVLCDKPAEDSVDINHILYRGEKNFIMLNLYPYNPAHLMITPYRHISRIEELTDEELQEHFALVRNGVKLLKQAINPSGFNVGMNLGKTAGAGIEEHIHSHIVPRWDGDNNFMPVISGIRVMPEALTDTYENLKGLPWKV